MALPTNTYLTFTAVGQREDLVDAIWNIDPTDTPFISSIARVKATGVKHEWQTDGLEDATIQGYLEGDDATADTATPTTRLDNSCQIFRKVVSVSRTQRTVLSAGRRDEYAYQLAKRGKEIKRNIEKTALSKNGKSVGAEASARYMGGSQTWLVKPAGGGNSVHLASTATSAGSGATVDITNITDITTDSATIKAYVDTVIASLWENGSDANVIICGSKMKQVLSGMTGIATLYREVPKGQQANIIGGADLYASNFGDYVIVPDRFTDVNTIQFFDYDYWAIAELDPIEVVPLAKTGDSDRAMIICELTLECRNPKASGKIANLTT